MRERRRVIHARETPAADDQQSSAIALGSLLLVGRAALCVYVGRVAALREKQQR
jgi:hypothetical protein